MALRMTTEVRGRHGYSRGNKGFSSTMSAVYFDLERIFSSIGCFDAGPSTERGSVYQIKVDQKGAVESFVIVESSLVTKQYKTRFFNARET